MENFSYYTIGKPSEGIYKEKGSKFLAFAYPVESEVTIKERIAELKTRFFDARHHCYAWVLGADRRHFRAFDDGEPNHSAGDPILGQIRSKNLTNVLIVVVRYFGGTKLGVGGLVSAYKTAAEDALRNTSVVLEEVKARIEVRFDYASTPTVMKLIKEFDLVIVSQNFASEGEMQLELPAKVKQALMEKVSLLSAMGSTIQVSEITQSW